MEKKNSTISIYRHVIDDVTSKVREEFIQNGAGDLVLSKLQALWEMKLMECGLFMRRPSQPKSSPHTSTSPSQPKTIKSSPNTSSKRSSKRSSKPSSTPSGRIAHKTPAPELPKHPKPLQIPIQRPLLGITEHQLCQTPTPDKYHPVGGPWDFAELQGGRPNPYMRPPSPWINQRPLGLDVNVAYGEEQDEVDRGVSYQRLTLDILTPPHRKRKQIEITSPNPPEGVIPQKDGSHGSFFDPVLPEVYNLRHPSSRHGNAITQVASVENSRVCPGLPQLDGNNDNDNYMSNLQEGSSEVHIPPRKQVLRDDAPSVSHAIPEVVDDDETPLNEDDDDTEDLVDDGDSEIQTCHLVLAQFEKVMRTKNIWKCKLKSGVGKINGEFLFNKADGEFEF